MKERRAHGRKVAGSIPAGSEKDFFLSRVNFRCLFRYPFHNPPPLPQWHVKDPGHSVSSAGGGLQLNTQAPLTQRCRSRLTMLPRHSVGTPLGNELTRNSSGNARPQSSQLTELLRTGSWRKKSGTGEHELISTPSLPPPPQRKKRRSGMIHRTFPHNSVLVRTPVTIEMTSSSHLNRRMKENSVFV